MKNLVTSNHFKEPGLNGFFGWLKRTVNNVLNAVSEVSHNPFFAFTVIRDAFDGGGFNIGNSNPGQFNTGLVRRNSGSEQLSDLNSQEVELKEAEEALLDLWVESRFKPLFLSYFTQMKQFSITPPKLNEFKIFYNNVYEFIGYINWSINNVVSHNSHLFLSNNVITARNRFLSIQMELLEADIKGYIESSNLNFNVKETPFNLYTNKYQTLDFVVEEYVFIQKKELIGNSVVETGTNISITDEEEITYTPPVINESPDVKPQSQEKGMKNGTKALLGISIGVFLSRLFK
ncbi:hypothetical protein [Winogradskyella sediminis]|uniref:hypothetical protein n=1 Tax=Winogradskyella sediminis TaxID=1382466 RepID=UPI000E249B81|nr:hypothetical protein [Winogradskyella sediminis]REG89900.1 hypothetical protein C8N41_1011146 [Winogradskyella sediminis]